MPSLITTAALTNALVRCFFASFRFPHIEAGSPTATAFSRPPRVRFRYGPYLDLTFSGLFPLCLTPRITLDTPNGRLRGERTIPREEPFILLTLCTLHGAPQTSQELYCYLSLANTRLSTRFESKKIISNAQNGLEFIL